MADPNVELAAAFALHQAGDLARATEAYRAFLRARPDHAEAQHLLGAVMMQRGELRLAVEHLTRAASCAADRPALGAQVLENLGRCALDLGDLAAARAHFTASLALGPNRATAHDLLAQVEHRAGDRAAAARAWREALRCAPDLAPALHNLGTASFDAGDLDGARECFARLVRCAPKDAGAHYHLGCVHDRRGEFAAARAAYARALELDPARGETWADLGHVLAFVGEHEPALAHLDRAVALAPERAAIRAGRGLTRLALGDFAGGLEDYEARLLLKVHQRGGLPGVRWRGEDLAGKRILLHVEQGAGDVIQFVRYAPLVAARGATVVVECQPELVAWFAHSGVAEEIVRRGEGLPPCDYHVGMLSLPHRFGTRAQSIPAAVPYLRAPEPPPPLARALDAAGARPRIGLAWAGNPDHPRDRQRTCAAASFARVVTDCDAAFFALQKGPQQDALAHAGVVTLGPLLEDFAATAAAVARLDLVVTVDTSVAHVAGALGKPVFVLLGIPEDWRWGRGRDDSAWYPSARLFRQERPGDWDGVIRRVRTALAERCAERLSTLSAGPATPRS